MGKIKFDDDLGKGGYYYVRYESRTATVPEEIKSTQELLEYIISRAEVNKHEMWELHIEKRNDWEKVEREELERLKAKYEKEPNS